MTSMAAAVARRAWISFFHGVAIDKEQSTMMISAALAGPVIPSAAEPADVTVTMALTSRVPSGRYRPALLEGFLSSTRLDLTPFCNPRLSDRSAAG
jgi:hypothetical protein